jgi:hypothetical protein
MLALLSLSATIARECQTGQQKDSTEIPRTGPVHGTTGGFIAVATVAGRSATPAPLSGN